LPVSVGEARQSIRRHLDFYNDRSTHSNLDGMTPDQAYFTDPHGSITSEDDPLSEAELLFRQPAPLFDALQIFGHRALLSSINSKHGTHFRRLSRSNPTVKLSIARRRGDGSHNHSICEIFRWIDRRCQFT
jgi:hypothetical protein